MYRHRNLVVENSFSITPFEMHVYRKKLPLRCRFLRLLCSACVASAEHFKRSNLNEFGYCIMGCIINKEKCGRELRGIIF